jgi:hypothetical protein
MSGCAQYDLFKGALIIIISDNYQHFSKFIYFVAICVNDSHHPWRQRRKMHHREVKSPATAVFSPLLI